ncbi:protein lifeguard 3 isoform X2 [Drosophila suzukii]|uniref:Protein lifeguard 3 isoform X2 n=1 Tax=Drosophila suzukii TaxID=28584 RepID=A0ABM4TN89_DROSZ
MCNRKRRYETNVFEDPAVRRMFATKVLAIVGINLTFTTLVMTICILVRPIRRFLQINWWIWIPAAVIIFIIHIMMCCFQSLFRKSPLNWVLLVIYVICHAVLVSCFAVLYRPLLVLMAFGVCAILVACLSVFARIAPCDFTACYTLIFVFGITVLALSILALYLRSVYVVYLGFAVIAYCTFIVYDLQMIVGGKIHKQQYYESDYIIAAMCLFNDVVYLFMFILEIAGLIDED